MKKEPYDENTDGVQKLKEDMKAPGRLASKTRPESGGPALRGAPFAATWSHPHAPRGSQSHRGEGPAGPAQPGVSSPGS